MYIYTYIYIYSPYIYIYINSITIYIYICLYTHLKYNITAIIAVFFLQIHAIFGLTQFLPKATIAGARQRPHQNTAGTDCFIGILIN